MKKLFLIPLIIVLVSGLVFGGCAAPAPAPTVEPIVIGNDACFTGHSCAANPWMLRGAELACEEFGWEIAGRPIKIVSEDSASEPTPGVDKAKKMVEVDKACVIIGPLPTPAHTAVSAYLTPLGIPHMGITQNIIENLQLGGRNEFIHAGTLRASGYRVGLYVYNVMGARTATVIHDDFSAGEDLTQGAMDAFVSLGGTIIQRQRTPMDTMDYGPYITAMKPADVILKWFVPDNNFRFCCQYYEYGMELPLVQTGCTTLGEHHLMELGDDGVGLISGHSYDRGVDTPAVKTFIDRWVKLHGHLTEEEGNYPEYAEGCCMYLSVSIALQAIKATGGDTSPDVLCEALRNITAETPWGPISFNDEGVGIGNAYVFQVVKEGDAYLRRPVYKFESIEKVQPEETWGIAPKM